MSIVVQAGSTDSFFLEAGARFDVQGPCEVLVSRWMTKFRVKIGSAEQQVGPFLSDAQVNILATSETTYLVYPAEVWVAPSVLAGVGGAASIGTTDGDTVQEKLDNIDGNLNFTTLDPATTPVDDADLMILRQGATNKKIDAGTFRTEFATEAVVAQDAAEVAAATATAARDATMYMNGVYPTPAAAIGNGVAGHGPITGGSGGTGGTFALAFSGGTGSGAAGRFVVSGGSLVSILITASGSYSVAPTFSFAASSGLTGASATLVLAPNVDVGEYFWSVDPDRTSVIVLYKVEAGPVATPQALTGSTEEVETFAVRSAMSTVGAAPSVTRSGHMNTLVLALKTAGVWDKLSTLQVHAAHAEAAAKIDWITATNVVNLVNAPTFVADKGWKTNGTSQYVRTGWNPGTDTNWAPDDGCVGEWSNFGASSAGQNCGVLGPGPSPQFGCALGFASTTNPSTISPRVIHGRNYFTSAWVAPASSWGDGVLAMSATSGDLQKFHSQGVVRQTTTAYAPASGESSLEYWIGAQNSSGSPLNYGVTSVGAFFAGQYLTDAEHTALHVALLAYMTAVSNVTTPMVGWGDSLSTTSAWYVGLAKQSDSTGRAFRRFSAQGVSAEDSSEIAVRMLADTVYNDYVQVIWAGRNDINNTTQTVDSASVLTNVAAMVAAAQARSNKYLVVSVTNGNLEGAPGGGGTVTLTNSEASGTAIHTAVVALNAQLETLYGDNFLDLRELLVAEGLNGDADDITDNGLDVPPRSLMYDDVHFSGSVVAPFTISGYEFIGRAIETKLQALGY